MRWLKLKNFEDIKTFGVYSSLSQSQSFFVFIDLLFTNLRLLCTYVACLNLLRLDWLFHYNQNMFHLVQSLRFSNNMNAFDRLQPQEWSG